MVVGGLLIAALITLRLFAPVYVVGQGIGAALAIGWVFALGLGVTLEKNVSVGRGSLWRVLLLTTSLIVGAATDFALGIKVLSSPKPEFPIPLALLFALIAMVCAVGWWRLLRSSREMLLKQSRLRFPLAIVVVFGIALLLVVRRFG